MTHHALFNSEPKEHWDNKLKEIEADHSYTAKEAKQKYKDGEIKDSIIFLITDGEFKFPGQEKAQPAWVIATFINGKLFFVRHSAADDRLPRLKRMAVARLMEIIKDRWVDTRKAPWLPPKMQNVDDPELVLHGAHSNSHLDDEGAFQKNKQVFPDMQ